MSEPIDRRAIREQYIAIGNRARDDYRTLQTELTAELLEHLRGTQTGTPYLFLAKRADEYLSTVSTMYLPLEMLFYYAAESNTSFDQLNEARLARKTKTEGDAS